MTNYSFVGYDVVKDVMYFKGVPIPDTRTLLGGEELSTPETQDVLFGYKTQENEILNPLAVTFLKNLLTDLSITATKFVDFRIEIEDSSSTPNISITAINLDETRSYTNTGVVETPLSIIEFILPKPKWKTMGKCRNCLSLNFLSGSNDYNLEGSIGGAWNNDYVNNQKRYKFDLIDYTDISNPTSTPYYIYWRPNITTSFTDYAGTPRTITNRHKWIAVPVDNPNNVNSDKVFFHIESQFDAACPYSTDNSEWYNFFGQKGFFRVNFAIPSTKPEVQCPDYRPSPAGGWGFNCNGDGLCVGAPSGSVGQYATLAECEASCSIEETGSFGWNCAITTPGACVQGTAANPGVYSTLQDCLNSGDCKVEQLFPAACSNCVDNLISNGGFDNNLNDFETSVFPNGIWGAFTPNGPAFVSPLGATLSGVFPNVTSSVFISQSSVFNASCSYSVCLEMWQDQPSTSSAAIIDVGGTSGQYLITGMASTPQAYTFNFTAGSNSDFTIYLAGNQRIFIDNICATLIDCPPGTDPDSDCIITGSADCFTDVEYDCLCPEGFIPNGFGNCIESGSILVPKIITGSAVNAPLQGQMPWGPYKPTLYSDYTINSVASNNTTSFNGNPRVYNTQFAFDILSASFWNADVVTGASGLAVWTTDGFTDQYTRAIPDDGTWYGGGNFINLTSSGTYHVAVIGDDSYRVRLNGDIIVEVDPDSIFGSDAQFQAQQRDSRNPAINPTSVNLGYLTGAAAGTYAYRCFHIYPVTMSAGCNEVVIEGRDTGGTYSTFAGLVLANTAQEIVDANNINDLNIIFNTRDDLIWELGEGSLTGSCPTGTTSTGPDNCDLCLATGSAIPCGDCLECVHGILYNGYVLDQGGPALLGRGTSGIVNTAASGAWALPNENDWDTLITYLNNGTSPTATSGELDVISGGKLKDYTRDDNASCWAFPNVGAQTDDDSSKWAGDASGQRTSIGTFDGLGFFGKWWIANSITPTNNQMKSIELKHYSNDVFKDTNVKNNGFSLRLVRPAVSGENNGDYITDAYTGNNGLIYDGIVIGTQVWINKNLSETQYNNSGAITDQPNNGAWSLATFQSRAYRCFYNNNSNLTSSLVGNINPDTGLCYEYPEFYIYRRCDNNNLLVQTESGSSTTLGDIQKSPIDGNCYTLIEIRNDNPDLSANIFYEGNYFSGSNYIYSDCEECEAIHTIYMNFGTKNC